MPSARSSRSCCANGANHARQPSRRKRFQSPAQAVPPESASAACPTLGAMPLIKPPIASNRAALGACSGDRTRMRLMRSVRWPNHRLAERTVLAIPIALPAHAAHRAGPVSAFANPNARLRNPVYISSPNTILQFRQIRLQDWMTLWENIVDLCGKSPTRNARCIRLDSEMRMHSAIE